MYKLYMINWTMLYIGYSNDLWLAWYIINQRENTVKPALVTTSIKQLLVLCDLI